MNHEETIFEQALETGAGQAREEFLRSACAGNDAMLERLQSLLRAHDRAGKFLEHERPAPAFGVPPSGGSAPGPAEAGTPNLLTEKPGDRIGRYKLLQKIGEGGCGVVYMAEQEQPVRRRVALKIIKLGMDTRQVIARFEAERQALALMDHPNIAKVFDAGVTDAPLPASGHALPVGRGEGAGDSQLSTLNPQLSPGRPYFVMELVRGVKITEYCDEKKLTTHERLDLFMQVCRAVQHAHQKGIIHRDLKPSNILVSLNDGVAVPKVIDFGIAKATTGEPLTNKTVFTAFEQFIGTPAYMSPEQALVTSLDIDTRTDIYSLGVLLYELLTGQTPFNPKELLQAGLEAMRRTIREKEPARPSTRLTDLVAADVRRLTTLSENDRASSRRLLQEKERLASQLRGDLDWIVMKCLEKDRARRYESANGLAADIQRHLNNEPVVACPPSNLYRFQKMLRRHRLIFSAVGAVAAALLVGLGFSTLMFIRERDASRRANEGEEKAEREASRARGAEADAQEKLWASYLAQAQARRWSGRVGRRVEALAALKKAAGIRPSLELRNESIACLALSDLIVFKEWEGFSCGSEFGAFDAGFERYARGETNGTISVRRVADDHELARFPGYGPPFVGMSFSPDGRFLLELGGPVNRLRLWDLQETRSVLVVTNDVPRTATFSADGRWLAVATFTEPDYPMRIFDLAASTLKQTLQLRSLAWGLHFHPTQTNLLATSDGGSNVRVWDWPRGALLHTFRHPGGVRTIFWHPEDLLLGAACDDYGVHIWHGGTGQKVARLRGHTGVVANVGFNRDGSLLFSSSWDGSLRLWDPAVPVELLNRLVPGGLVSGFHGTMDRMGYVAGPGRLGLLQVVQPAGYHALRPKETDDVRVSSCEFGGDGRILASSHERHIRFWDVATGRQIARMPTDLPNAAFSSDGQRLFTGNLRGIQEWAVHFSTAGDHVALRPTRQFPLVTGDILLNRDATLLGGVAQGTQRFELLDLLAGQFKGPFNVSNAFFAALSPDGKLGATWPRGGNAHIEITDLSSAQTVARLPVRSGARAVFSPNGRFLATGDNTEFRLWHRETWKPLYTVPRQFTDNWCKLAFSPDSSMLAVAHSRDVVKLLETASGKELATLEAPEPQDIYWISFNPNGTQLAVASANGPIHLWDLRLIRQQLAEMKLDWELPPLPPRSRMDARPIKLTFIGVTNPPPTDTAFPARDPLLSPKLIDLSAHYNSPIRKVRRETYYRLTNDFSTLPTGAPTLGGTQFDLRGIVQLLGSELEKRDEGLPKACRGIQVAQTCRALRFLHATRFGEQITAGTLIGQYVLRYADGLEHVIPIKYGEDVRSWWRLSHQPETASRAEIAWRDDNPRGPIRLFKLTVENPRPEALVESIDFVSAMTAAAPLLLAITVE